MEVTYPHMTRTANRMVMYICVVVGMMFRCYPITFVKLGNDVILIAYACQKKQSIFKALCPKNCYCDKVLVFNESV